MHTSSRRFAARALPLAPVLLCSSALAIGLLAPASAGAERADRSALRAGREQLRAERAEQRASRAQERRSLREQERAARRSAREQERSARRAERHGAAAESTTGAGSGPLDSAAGSGASSKCRATIELSASSITVGDTVTIFGELTCPAGVSVAGQQVTVYERERRSGPAGFTVLGNATTEADGSYKLTSLAFDTSRILRVRVGDHGARAVVEVAPTVTLSDPAPTARLSTVAGGSRSARPARVIFSGAVDPAGRASRVALQVAYEATGEQWRTVAFGVLNADGSFSVAHGFRTAGQVSVRVLVHLRGQHAVTASEPITYEVAQTQNPQLTIASSAPRASYGQTVTISGVAAGAAGQSVTLLARTHGGAFAPVATATTDPAGNYSFTQTPTQSTRYRVTDSATQSTVLFQGVKRALVVDAVQSTVVAGTPMTLSGSVDPADDGQLIYAERENASGIGFHVVASAPITGSSFAIAHVFSNAGNYVMRLRLPGDAALEAVTSATFSFAVTPAPASELTPEAPAASPAS